MNRAIITEGVTNGRIAEGQTIGFEHSQIDLFQPARYCGQASVDESVKMYSALRDPSVEYGCTPRSKAGMVFLTRTPWGWTSSGSRDNVSCSRLCVSMRAVLISVPILKITVKVACNPSRAAQSQHWARVWWSIHPARVR